MSHRSAIRAAPLLLLALAAAWGLFAAAAQAWTCDDAFISFRYARNLVDGLGLVFNAGERVEGYTNFSWTMLLAAGMALGADPVAAATVLGLACFAGTIAVLAWASRRLLPAGGAWWPAAAIACALHGHAQVFATGGLETSLFTLTTTATLCAAVAARTAAGAAGAGCLGVLSAMTRPDGMLVYGVAGFSLLLRGVAAGRGPRWMLAAAAPGLLLYLPYWLWRFSYYGYPFPNTFYAKSAAQPYPQQGLYYVMVYFGCYHVLGLGVLGGLYAMLAGGRRAAPADRQWPIRGAAWTWLGGAALYVAFVVWVGGDFMFGRFLVPLTPILLLAAELPRARFAGPVAGVVLTALLAGLTLARSYPEAEVGGAPSGRRGVVEEPRNYPPEKTAAMRQAGDHLRRLFAGRDVRVVIEGAQAVLAYYGEFPLVIEGCTGLTDEYLAHQPLAERRSIGHEKSVHLHPDYLLRRQVHFSLHLDPASFVAGHPRHIRFGPVFGVIITYDRALMRYLASQPDVEFVDYEARLDAAIADLPDHSDAEVRALWHEAKQFYFDHNDDPARQAAFEARLGG